MRSFLFLLTILAIVKVSGQCPETTLLFYSYRSDTYGGGYTGNHCYKFSSQSQIDSFRINYPLCTEIADIFIGDQDSLTDITNLDSLVGLSCLGGFAMVNTKVREANVSGRRIFLAKNDSLEGFYLTNPSPKMDLTIVENSSLVNFDNTNLIDQSEIFNLIIVNNENLSSLSGLSSLRKMNILRLTGNISLTDLSGVEKLDTLTSTLEVTYNTDLRSLHGLEGLVSIEFGLTINDNDNLNDISALLGVSKLSKGIQIYHNPLLLSLHGLDSLESVGENIQIYGNGILDLTGFTNLRSIHGDLNLQGNDNLVTLYGLDQLDSVGGEIILLHNRNLSYCATTSICSLIASGVPTNIFANTGFCEDGNALFSDCGFKSDCPYNILLGRQTQVDSFPLIYPGCDHVINNLSISNPDIDNVMALRNLKYVGRQLFFSKTGLLDLQGVTNIETVGGNFYISDNDQLLDLNGLENLRIVGGSLSVSNNDSLESLHGIATLDSIYGGLSISSNLMLQSITGLVGLKYIGSYVSIVGNTELGNCHSSYLCKILPDKYDFIRSNLPGCNSKTEILSQCDCPLDITLSNGDGLHYASNSITTSGNIQIGLFSELNSQTVSIQPEFVVPLGAVLLINNFGCTND